MRPIIELFDPRLPDRFWSKVIPEPNSGCWLWTACVQVPGYGRYRNSVATEYAHRVAYTALVGEVPNGMDIDHRCRTKCCINPAHLEPVTHAENVRRGDGWKVNGSKTHCPRGHAYDAELRRERGIERFCRQCARMHKRNYEERRRC